MTEILLVASQHGDEPLGHLVYEYIRRHHPDLLEHCELYVANPLAINFGRRYIDSDMNRSFDTGSSSYEAEQARTLVRHIKTTKPGLVLDLHTTTCIQGPSLILTGDMRNRRRYIDASSIKQVMKMANSIARHSLIGVVPNAISVEVSEADLNIETFEALVNDMYRYLNKQRYAPDKRYYEISSMIGKHEYSKEYISSLRNFEPTIHGFVPYLLGPNNSYSKQTDYLGFKAVPTTDNEL